MNFVILFIVFDGQCNMVAFYCSQGYRVLSMIKNMYCLSCNVFVVVF